MELQSVAPAQAPNPGDLAATRAIVLDGRIKDLEEEVKQLKESKALAIEEAYKNGITEYDGYRFIEKSSPQTVTDESITAYDVAHDTDLLDGFIKWFRQNVEIKLSQASFKKFLLTVAKDTAELEEIMAGCLTDKVTEAPAFVLMAPKKGAGQ